MEKKKSKTFFSRFSQLILKTSNKYFLELQPYPMTRITIAIVMCICLFIFLRFSPGRFVRDYNSSTSPKIIKIGDAFVM